MIIAVTVVAYWIGIGTMIVRVRRHAHKVVGVIPEQGVERLMWTLWVPLAIVWIALPWLALSRVEPPLGLPEFARSSSYAMVRIVAAVIGLAALAATV